MHSDIGQAMLQVRRCDRPQTVYVENPKRILRVEIRPVDCVIFGQFDLPVEHYLLVYHVHYSSFRLLVYWQIETISVDRAGRCRPNHRVFDQGACLFN